jgi:hypothetical protein
LASLKYAEPHACGSVEKRLDAIYFWRGIFDAHNVRVFRNADDRLGGHRRRHAEMMVKHQRDGARIGYSQQVFNQFRLRNFKQQRRHHHGNVGTILCRVPGIANSLLESQATDAGIDQRLRRYRLAGRRGKRPAIVFIKKSRFAGRRRNKDAVAAMFCQLRTKLFGCLTIHNPRTAARSDHCGDHARIFWGS